MNGRNEYILPVCSGSENGRIISYKINPYAELWYIDIRSRRLPDMPAVEAAGEDHPFMTVNYSFKGKCELLLKNGEATYLDTGEYAIDDGTACQDKGTFYYPRAEYHGLELFLYPGKELDQALSLQSMTCSSTTELEKRHAGREEPFISKAGARIVHTMEMIAEDILAGGDLELMTLNVGRLLNLLSSECAEMETARTYYSGSQVQIVRRAMDLLTEDLSKRHSAAELAQKFGISETCLKNYFRGVYGRGYSELLNEIRMEKAADLLLDGKSKIAQISDAVGFATQSRFARAFKNYFGVTPMEYKRTRMLQKEQER